jgi:hypothetical protein
VTKVLIDGDIVAYRAAAIIEADFWDFLRERAEVINSDVYNYLSLNLESFPEDFDLGSLYRFKETHSEVFEDLFISGDFGRDNLQMTLEKLEGVLDRILTNLQDHDVNLAFISSKDCEVFLTGKGNYRFDVAKHVPYKGNRVDKPKPIYLGACRDYLEEVWGAKLSDGEEADDLIAIAATKYGPTSVVVSIDKDMLQIPCKHYNFVKNEWTEVSEFEGLKFFYSQILTGDSADNIVGLYRVGPKKAEQLLENCDDEEELWEAVIKAYDGDIDRVVENARLLWLRREEEELWQPPDHRKPKDG